MTAFQIEQREKYERRKARRIAATKAARKRHRKAGKSWRSVRVVIMSGGAFSPR